MIITNLPSPGTYSNSQRLRMEAVKAIGHLELANTPAGKSITSITITAGGTGYTNGKHELVITNGYGASAFATVAGGIVTAIQIVNPGTGYAAPVVSLPASAGAGTGAILAAVLSTGVPRTTASGKQLRDFFTACAAACADYATP